MSDMANTPTTTIGGGTANQSAPGRGADNKSDHPIRWPRPDGAGIMLFLLWVGGVVLALGVPGLIVGPGEETAPTGDILLAVGLTIVGCLVMMVSSYILYRRSGEIAAVMFGAVPAFSCLAGGIILAATKLTAPGTSLNL